MTNFKDEQTCIKYFEQVRFKNGEYCPHCGFNKINHFADGKRYRCAKCKKDFTIKTKTVFGESKVPMQKWFVVIYLLTTSKKGISSISLAQQVEVTQKTAWFMDRRIRKAMKQNAGEFDEVIRSIADEQKPEVMAAARPFLKWVGGKRSILPELLGRMPKTYSKYYEPFLGGGALFFAAHPAQAFLSDINFHLIVSFQAVRDNVDALIDQLEVFENRHNAQFFENARLRLFKEKDPVKIAALFIYLNKTCYNGLYRVNQSGKFNVPMGNYKDPAILDGDNLRNCSKVLQGVSIIQQGFTQLKPKRGDFYYLDPPYHKTFDGYNRSGFGDDKQIALAALCDRINDAGAYFMLSNSDTDFVKTLYKKYNKENVSASRMVSCKKDQRGKQNELIIRNYS